jgi:alpha-beta hydrolase superfamily lysophospholipase
MKRNIRDRDGQQWINDYMLKATGRAVHYELDTRLMPPQAKSMRMVSKYVLKEAEHAEYLARKAEEYGDLINAKPLYLLAMNKYREAQHYFIPIMSDKRWAIYEKTKECSKRLYALMDYPIEVIEIPFGDTTLPAVLHLQPGGVKAPAVVFIPGMDMTKESYPNPLDSEYHQRGMHVITIDGPGQGESWRRGLYVTPYNHIEAAKAAFDFMAARDDVDETRIGVSGRSFGSLWSMLAAANEPRFAAVASAVANYQWDYLKIFDEAPIRFKQVFMAMAGMDDEDAFDKMAEGFTLKGQAQNIKCPALMCVGEFDPLNPIEDAEKAFEALTCPKELWVIEDEYHSTHTTKALCGRPTFHYLAEWMDRALNGKIPKDHNRRTFITKEGRGLYED